MTAYTFVCSWPIKPHTTIGTRELVREALDDLRHVAADLGLWVTDHDAPTIEPGSWVHEPKATHGIKIIARVTPWAQAINPAHPL